MGRTMRKFGALGIILLHVWMFAVFPVHVFAQEAAKDATSACLDAEYAAAANTSAGSWFAVGCLFGLLGWLVAYVMEPAPPATALLGKSPEYVAVYTDCYRREAKEIRAKNALTGCLVGTAAQILLNVLLWVVILAEEDDDYYY